QVPRQLARRFDGVMAFDLHNALSVSFVYQSSCSDQPAQLRQPVHRHWCPQPGHSPRVSKVLYFFDGCGTMWNTFLTRRLGHGCGHQWRWTGCLSCAGWSLHEDWYTKETDKAL